MPDICIYEPFGLDGSKCYVSCPTPPPANHTVCPGGFDMNGCPMPDTYIPVQACTQMGWLGDGFCDDATNTESCYYDGGDCCGTNVDTQYCTICQCIDEG